MLDRLRLKDICCEAGQIAMRQWPGDGHKVEVWDKGSDSPVSAADIEVDGYLKHELGKLLPSAAWLSEETADDSARTQKGLVWVVDPIDGTRDYIHGRRGWAISVALVSSGRPLMGLLVAPARDEVWTATAGRGARLNGKELTASTRSEFSGARVPADSLMREDQDLAMVEKPNSIALRIAMVADNRADLVATVRWGFEWDIAASTLIAREAGAKATDAFGNPLNFNKHDPRAFGLLVCAPAIHGDAVERLADRAEKYSAV